MSSHISDRKNLLLKTGFVGAACFFAATAYGAGGGAGVAFVNWYEVVLTSFGLSHEQCIDWIPVLGSCLVLSIITSVGLLYNQALAKQGSDFAPSSSFGVTTIVEGLLDFVINLCRDVIGPKAYRPFLPLLVAVFFYIFVSNITGLIPGFPPATESINTNLAMGLSVFIVYNIAGIREHGGAYVKQFTGPMLVLAPLFLFIEIISHLVRPVSLSLRLYGNIFGDHLVMSVVTGLTYLVLPAFFLFFGLLVASIQSFVFTLLSSIYISMAISHDH